MTTTGSAVVAVMWDFSQVEPDYMAFVNVCNCFYKYINLPSPYLYHCYYKLYSPTLRKWDETIEYI